MWIAHMLELALSIAVAHRYGVREACNEQQQQYSDHRHNASAVSETEEL
jgi:hypothetical protein